MRNLAVKSRNERPRVQLRPAVQSQGQVDVHDEEALVLIVTLPGAGARPESDEF